MTVMNFEEYVEESRKRFSKRIHDGEYDMIDMKIFIKRIFKKCTNQFEEDTLIENLKEEFEDYLKEVKEQA